jgi:hypothetical protein
VVGDSPRRRARPLFFPSIFSFFRSRHIRPLLFSATYIDSTISTFRNEAFPKNICRWPRSDGIRANKRPFNVHQEDETGTVVLGKHELYLLDASVLARAQHRGMSQLGSRSVSKSGLQRDRNTGRWITNTNCIKDSFMWRKGFDWPCRQPHTRRRNEQGRSKKLFAQQSTE